MHGREEAEEQTSAKRQRRGEQQRRGIELHRDRVCYLSGEDRGDQTQRPACDEQSADAAEHGEEARFHQELAHELPPACAEREANRHLTRTRRRPRQQ